MHEALMELIGETVGGGRFRLDRALGRGGMGAVFAGVDVATGQPVAIKLIHPGLGDEPELVARFQREAEVIARLEHPHVVRSVAAGGGGGEGGPPFIAMELLAGGSLEARLKGGETFDARRSVVIARQILAALAASHAIGVIHRDLKPANVMIVDGPAGPVAKLVDFGVARLAMGEAMTRLTATGQVVGTATYMAPEQALGGPADARSDVFSVGAILHRLLAGTPPYGSGNYARLLQRIVGNQRRPIDETVPGLGPLADVIEGALAHSPESRFQSADALAQALDGIDAAAHDTVVHWRPPVDLRALRLPPAAMDSPTPAPPRAPSPAGGASAPPGPSSGAAPPTTPDGRPRIALAAVLVVAAVGLGVAGTWVVLRPGNVEVVPRAAEAAVAAGPVTPAAPAVPVVPIDVSATAPAETTMEQATPEPSPAPSPAPVKNAHRRTAPGAGVIVRYSGGEFRVRGSNSQVRAVLGDRDFSGCWPPQDPMPEFNRGASYRIGVGPTGRIESAEVVGRDYYPAFNRCMERRITSIEVGAELAGRDMRVSFALYSP